MRTSTVSVSFARGLIDFCASKGIDRGALAARSDFDLAALNDPNARTALPRFVALIRTGQELCSDPALALHFGDSPYAETSIGCVIGSFAESGADGFALINRYARLNVDVGVAGADRFVVARTGDQSWILDTRTDPNEFPELTELTFACMISTARRQLGENHPLKRLHVTHAAPAHSAEYERVLRIPVVFGSDKNALLLADEGWMAERPRSASPIVLEALSARAEALLGRLEVTTSTEARVVSLLTTMIAAGDASADTLAGRMGMSRQTLFRRLRAEGTSFASILDKVRRELALQCLRDEKLRVEETAYRVGFSDRASFARAFKRWTGLTPARFVGREPREHAPAPSGTPPATFRR